MRASIDSMPIVLYVSEKCSNCQRLMNTVRLIPSLQTSRVVNIEQSPTPGIDRVPTLVDERGQRYVGGKAFEFLKKYEQEIQLQPMQLGTGSLAYGSIENGGELGYIDGFYNLK